MTWYIEHAVFLDHWDDVISDLSAIHHIRVPLERLPACWLWPVVERLAAYAGVLRARAEADQSNQPGHSQRSSSRPGATAQSPSSHTDSKGRHVNPVRDFRPDDPLLKGHVETSHHKPVARKGA
ncbi:hypothetical protein ACWFMI_23520 [Nocardiopsis terrae]|uniref:hypothetical protein n=1 Tax=Streptomyces sp. NPDC057554 TaxID=3350538 RepID=UPI00369A30CB